MPQAFLKNSWWREKDSNLRRLCRQIYSLIPLTARESLHCLAKQRLLLEEVAIIA